MTMAAPVKPDLEIELFKMPSAQLLLTAIIHGCARWEWFPSRLSGEVCIAGLRHTCDVVRGTPQLTHRLRGELLKELSKLELVGFES